MLAYIRIITIGANFLVEELVPSQAVAFNHTRIYVSPFTSCMHLATHLMSLPLILLSTCTGIKVVF